MSWVWYAWFVVVLCLVVLPVGYGAGYRRWGPPRPRFYRRSPAGQPAQSPGHEHVVTATNRRVAEEIPAGWGVLGDVVWIAAAAALIWAVLIVWT